MINIQAHGHIDEHGMLRIQTPTALRDVEVEILIVLQPISDSSQNTGSGWPEGFLDSTYGSLADEPIERLPQGKAETREAMQFGEKLQ
ncbi:MAG: hypothetical protein ABIY70_16075 [Capsulimonas sp.]|uniref:hypothetical protein n=1 Tax=Capsulimonas sp. TaxID=2494211 RepID=UPI003266459E